MLASQSQKLKELYEFGPFRVDPEKDTLLRDGEVIPLQPKTFQILLVLLRYHQQLVTKEDLLKAVWPDSFVEEANLSRNIFLLRKALGESPQDHQYILTVPGRGYRFAENVRSVTEHDGSVVAEKHAEAQNATPRIKFWRWAAVTVIVGLVVIGVTVWFLIPQKPVPGEKVTVVLVDFKNSTGDTVFDGTLRQGLAVELDQSPFLSLASDDHIRETLALMGKPSDQPLTPEIGREVCERTGSVAVLDGSIATLGSEYILGLRAVNCRTGDVLAEEQETASSKEKTLAALDQIAGKLRGKLGESLSTVEKFATPLEEATTPSLEALQAYTLGRQMMVGKDQFAEAVPFFQRAIQLDPNFAMAYAALGSCYQRLWETELGEENIERAYGLRAHLSQPEKFYIESTYYHYATGDLEKARQVYELAAQTYPRYSGTHLRLWQLYSELGDYEKSLAEINEAIRLDPARAVDYMDLIENYIDLNRLQDARNLMNKIYADEIESSDLHIKIYILDFLEHDPAGMKNQAEWIAGKPEAEDILLALESETAAYAGRMNQSRSFSQRAMDSAMHAQNKELVALYDANQSLWESLVGNKAQARQHADSALKLSKGREVVYEAALSLAFIGEQSQAQGLAEDLSKRFPDHTKVQFNFLPTIRAQIALSHNDPLQAISLLQPATRYELGKSGWTQMGAIYVRGEAYLAAHHWTEAAAEFQKILDHPGIAANHPFGALAHLQMGRAYAAAGDKAKAKRCYGDFLTLWKDADSNIPLLKEAKAESKKLE